MSKPEKNNLICIMQHAFKEAGYSTVRGYDKKENHCSLAVIKPFNEKIKGTGVVEFTFSDITGTKLESMKGFVRPPEDPYEYEKQVL